MTGSLKFSQWPMTNDKLFEVFYPLFFTIPSLRRDLIHQTQNNQQNDRGIDRE
jgi:hypothetical protein